MARKKDEKQQKWINENEEVSKWLMELERKSKNTAKARRYHIYYYCIWLAEEKKILNPKQLLSDYKLLKRTDGEYKHIDWLKEYIFSVEAIFRRKRFIAFRRRTVVRIGVF